MLQHMIEELEHILFETSKLKNDLNYSCEKSWNLLCPPGSKINEFKTEKEMVPSDKDESSESSNISHSMGSALDSVAGLIAYGKLLRNSAQLENKKRCSNVSLEVKGSLPNKPSQNKLTTTFTKFETSLKDSILQKERHKVNNSSDSKKVANLKKSPHTSKKCPDLENCTTLRNNPDIIRYAGVAESKSIPKGQVLDKDRDYVKVHTPKYSHLCSGSLSDIVRSLKMPEDMYYLLKHYFHYESIKMKHNIQKQIYNAADFSKSINNLAKFKLENDLRTSRKEKDRYFKYLDVADKVCRGKEGNFKSLGNSGCCSIVWYESPGQLCLYEDKCQRFFELQLQRRLMGVLEMHSKLKQTV